MEGVACRQPAMEQVSGALLLAWRSICVCRLEFEGKHAGIHREEELRRGSLSLQQQIVANIDALRGEGISVLLVEQNARLSLARSDRGYIFANGKVVHTSSANNILNDPHIGEYFLGLRQ
jgi:hypothetical protein